MPSMLDCPLLMPSTVDVLRPSAVGLCPSAVGPPATVISCQLRVVDPLLILSIVLVVLRLERLPIVLPLPPPPMRLAKALLILKDIPGVPAEMLPIASRPPPKPPTFIPA